MIFHDHICGHYYYFLRDYNSNITIRFFPRYFSKRPHVGGTKRSKELADEIARRWNEYKFDNVEQPEYDILLPYVDPDVSNSVQILNSTRNVAFEFSGREEVDAVVNL